LAQATPARSTCCSARLLAQPPAPTLPGGVILPLNFDYLSGAMAAQFNTGMFQNTIGLLNTRGRW
jgi:hypothetical protein